MTCDGLRPAVGHRVISYRVTIKKYSISKEVTPLSEIDDHAIVIGGSIAGLLAARVLADSFTRVTVIDRDKLPQQPELRKGVPQSAQPHVLFTRGYRILEELFPGIGNELIAAGALTIDWAQEFDHFGRGGWSAKAESASGIVSLTCSRPLLEWAIRQRLTAYVKVRFVEACRVTGLLSEPGKTSVAGVSLAAGEESGHTPLLAKLIVDASGRGSQAPAWLKSLGFTPPEETVVNPFLGYATRRYQAPPGLQPDWKVMLIGQSPPSGTRLGYIAQIENQEWIVTLGGYGRDFPPMDDEGFLAFAQTLPSSRFYQAIQAAKPVSPIYAHRATANRLRHYEKAKLPQGFIALGDAVCALCPVYGQGMTVSALSALVLRDWLAQYPKNNLPAGEFQKSLAKSNSLSWSLATAQDLRFPTTAGRRDSGPGWLGKLMHGYSDRLLQMANEDPDLHTLFMEVAHLLKSPLALYHPKVMLRTLGSLRF